MLKVLQSLKVDDHFVNEVSSLTSRYIQSNSIVKVKSSDKTIEQTRKKNRILKSKTTKAVKSKTTLNTKIDKFVSSSSVSNNIINGINSVLDDNWYIMDGHRGRYDTFYSAVLMILDDDYCALSGRERLSRIGTLKKKMLVDLVGENLYRLFQYHLDRSFNKTELVEALTEGKIIPVIYKYLSDYFDINICCIEKSTKRSKIYRNKCYRTVSIILIENENGTYSSVLSSSGNHFIHPDSIKKVIDKYPLKESIKPEKKIIDKPKFKSIKLSDKHYTENKFRLYSIGRYTIGELQNIADTYNISLYNIKVLKSGEKRVKNKTKNELYTLIKERCEIKE